MGSNEIGFNPEKITFGIEVEVVAAGFTKGSILHGVQQEEKILHDVAKCLTDAGVEVELICDTFPSEKPSYTKWVVTEDISIMYDPNAIIEFFSQHPSWRVEKLIHGGVEIISPVLHVVPPEDWKAEISNVLRILKDNYRLHFNRSTGLHVHVGYGESEFPFPKLLNIAAVLVLFEPVIERWVHPGHRGVTLLNKYIKSNRKNAKLEHLTNLQVFKRISGSIGTIEFRQHQGTNDVEDIHMWVLFCTALVRAAAAINGETIQELASRDLLRLEDLSQLVGEKFVSYYRGKFLYELL
ncbi:hypothetical protein RUND412_005809 [Rhizina undulata]